MRVLRRGIGIAIVGATVAVAVPSSFAQQPPVELKPRLELKIGKHLSQFDARAASIDGSIDRLPPPDGARSPVLTGGRIWLPRGLKLNGGEFPVCHPGGMRLAVVRPCPDSTIVGERRSGGFAQTAVVGPFTETDVLFVNHGPRRILAEMTVFNPAFVRESVLIRARKPERRRWAYRLTFKVPQILQLIGGVPVALEGFPLHVDGIDRVPGYLTFDRRCPKRGYLAYRASLTFLHDDGTVSEVTRRGRMRCAGAAQPGRGPSQ